MDATEDQHCMGGPYSRRHIKGRGDDTGPCIKRVRQPSQRRDFSGYSFDNYRPGNSGGDGGETQLSWPLGQEKTGIPAQDGGRGGSLGGSGPYPWSIQSPHQEKRCMYDLPGQGCNGGREKAHMGDIPAQNGGGSGKEGVQSLGKEKACIILDDSEEEEEEEVQFLGEGKIEPLSPPPSRR